MKEKIKKILSLLFVTLSVLLLFVSWVKFEREDLFEYFDVYGDNTLSEFKRDVEDYYKGIKEDVEEYTDTKIGTSKIKKAAEVFYDFQLSPSEMDTYSSIMAKPYRSYAKYYNEEYLGSNDVEEAVSLLNTMSTGFTIFHIIYLLTWVAFALYAVNAVTGKLAPFKYLFFIMRVLMVAVVVFAVFYNNNENLIDLESSLTLWPFIALILALPESLYMPFIDKLLNNQQLEAAFANAGNAVKQSFPTEQIKQTVKSATSNIGFDSGWTCPDCNTKNGADSKFCAGCGKPNPFIVKCPTCGKELKDHEKFCPDCGTTITWIETDLTCPSCGAKNPLDSMFCENCGAKLKD